ncbi:hypothetical protein EDE09_12452 [Neorhizobium sp. S3-V5DH]|nr:hypothetical protein EDE09_12452 [Neorhizobium sp. S3-V5DH]
MGCHPYHGHRRTRSNFFTAGIAIAFLLITIGCIHGALS